MFAYDTLIINFNIKIFYVCTRTHVVAAFIVGRTNNLFPLTRIAFPLNIL